MGAFYFAKEGEDMRICDYLSKEQKRQLNNMTKGKPKKKKRKKKTPGLHEGGIVPKPEKVNWIEIMGMNRDRYGRGPGGAMRRK